MIKLGVTPRFYYKLFGPKIIAGLEQDAACYLSSQGVMPILIPNVPHLESFLKELDGFVLQGGADVAPEAYGEKGEKWPGDSYRDQFEMKVLDFAIKKEKPLLGICRGLQLLNVYFGGTLHQDLPSHKDENAFDGHSHPVKLISGGLLSHIYQGKTHVEVNSLHHQGIKKLAPKLIVEAICEEDGLIEAVSSEGGRIVAVQWHPEFFHPARSKLLDPNPLIEYFIQKCIPK